MKLRRPSILLIFGALYGLAAVGSIGKAIATPQFARQTNLQCVSCHEHVPLLNAFGQKFYANGFRLSKGHKMVNTVPLWASVGVQGTTSRSLGSSVPISYASTEIASYGFLDNLNLLYHVEYQPTQSQTDIYAIRPVGKNLSVAAGELGLLSQYDPRLDVSLSRPVNLSPAGAGPLGNGRIGPFSPGSNAYAVRVIDSLSGNGALPYADGWKVAATVPFSAEEPCGTAPVFQSDPTGVFLEGYKRTGMNSYGVNLFEGRDGRRFYGVVGQEAFGKFLLEGRASYATFNGADSKVASIGCSWTPSWDKALAFRIDDQDGFVNYIPTASWLLGGKMGVIRLVAEATITKGVAPTTIISAQLKF